MMRTGRRRSSTDFAKSNDVASIPFSRETAPYHEINHPVSTRRSMKEYSWSSSFLAGRRRVLDPEDFSDVFGGPPRSVVLSREGEYSSFYEEIFRASGTARNAAGWRGGRSLLMLRIPAARGEGFYDDVFGVDEVAPGRRSKERSRPGSKAKSISSSVLSSEEINPSRRRVARAEAVVSSFASKLRPINVACRWNSNTMMTEYHMKKKEKPSFPGCQSQSSNYYNETDRSQNTQSSYFKVSRQVSSPETISLEPTSYPSFKASADDLELLSPASPGSSLCQEEDEVMSSYVIDINSIHRVGMAEAVSINGAIAWAKEKFQAYSSGIQSPEDRSSDIEGTYTAEDYAGIQIHRYGEMRSPCTMQRETKFLDEDVRSWSTGKEQHPSAAFNTTPHELPASWMVCSPSNKTDRKLTSEKGLPASEVCLHPGKMQQRGATFQQKYVAEKPFQILQVKFGYFSIDFLREPADHLRPPCSQVAWAAFVSQDALFN